MGVKEFSLVTPNGTPLYENGIKKTQIKSMDTTSFKTVTILKLKNTLWSSGLWPNTSNISSYSAKGRGIESLSFYFFVKGEIYCSFTHRQTEVSSSSLHAYSSHTFLSHTPKSMNVSYKRRKEK